MQLTHHLLRKGKKLFCAKFSPHHSIRSILILPDVTGVEGGCLKLVRLDAWPVPGCYSKVIGFLQTDLYLMLTCHWHRSNSLQLATCLKLNSKVILHTIYLVKECTAPACSGSKDKVKELFHEM